MNKQQLEALVRTALRSEDPRVREDFVQSRELLDSCSRPEQIHIAAAIMLSKQRISGVRYLIENGLDVNSRNGYMHTLAMLASHEGNIQGLRMLGDLHADFEAVDDEGGDALTYAARNGQLECLKYLCDQGVSIFGFDESGYSLLHRMETLDLRPRGIESLPALQENILSCVSYLVEQGLSLEHFDNLSGVTPLIKAINDGSIRLALHFIDLGADVNASDQMGNLPLGIAAHQGQLQVLQRLIERGADLEASSADGETALFLACMNGRFDCLVALLEAGASSHLSSKDLEHIVRSDDEGKQALALIAAHQARLVAAQAIGEIASSKEVRP